MTNAPTPARALRTPLSILMALSLLIAVPVSAGWFSKDKEEEKAAGGGSLWRQMPESQKKESPFQLTDQTYVELAEMVTPSTVNIKTEVEATPRDREEYHGFKDFRDFFRRFGNPQPHRKQGGAGSGFIINPEGDILTNNHVVEGADKVTVQLLDGRSYTAKVLGRDPKTDIALIKIDTEEELPWSYLGDSDAVEIGQPAVAIGNPFGVGTTMTRGIVSALGRRLGAGPYDDFIQTDASINPGNSGGPLFNIHGEVIGINSMIYSRGGGSVGIGFAIPINMAKPIITQLRDKGKVSRGFIGVNIQAVDEALAGQFGLEEPMGALVTGIIPGSPAEGSELKQGDIILEFEGHEIREMNDLPFIVAQTPGGAEVEITLWRDGKRKSIDFTIGLMPDELGGVSSTVSPGEKDYLAETFGIEATDITPQIVQQWELEKGDGVLVTDVEPGSIADDSGLMPGDQILEAKREKIANLADLTKILEEDDVDSTLLLVRRAKGTHFLVLKRGEE